MAKRSLEDYEKVQNEMEEAQKTIEDLQESLKEYRDTSKVSETEMEEFKQDINFYR